MTLKKIEKEEELKEHQWYLVKVDGIPISGECIKGSRMYIDDSHDFYHFEDCEEVYLIEQSYSPAY